ncbi:MAG: trypsin-like peptidase domain-containing protein [Paracoccaceae bacterium]|nr:MAG: trypsin-like peptidase domain-containing protein [Paracoccaceae bacterium]
MDARIVFGVILAVVAVSGVLVLGGLAGSAARPLANVTVVRVLYSAVLVTAAMFLLRELEGLWARPPTTIGPLKYSIEGKPDDVRAEALGHRIRERYASLNRFFRDLAAQRAREVAAERGGGQVVPSLEGTPALTREGETPLEINVQGVDFGRILGALRKSVYSSDQIAGTVVAGKDGAAPVAMLNWAGAPQPAHLPGETARLMAFDTATNEDELATAIACAMIWAQAVQPEASTIRWVRRTQYCDWVTAALIWRDLVDRAAAPGGLVEGDLLRLGRARGLVDRLHAQKVTFAEVYRLRASLISLDPAATEADAVTAKESTFIAAQIQQGRSFDEALAELVKEQERERAQERERVAAAATSPDPGTLFAPTLASPTLKAILTRSWQALPQERTGAVFGAASAATGAVIVAGRENPLVGTGFVVGPGLVMTTREVAEVMQAAVTSATLGGFTLSANPREPGEVHRVAAVTLLETPAGGLAVLHLPTLPDTPAPLDLADSPGAAVAGRAIGIVGYPVDSGAALLSAWAAAPAGWPERATGTRLAGLGRIIAAPGSASDRLVHDATTFPGHSGAPVIDMETGRVLAVHSAKDSEGRGMAVPLLEGMLASLRPMTPPRP